MTSPVAMKKPLAAAVFAFVCVLSFAPQAKAADLSITLSSDGGYQASYNDSSEAAPAPVYVPVVYYTQNNRAEWERHEEWRREQIRAHERYEHHAREERYEREIREHRYNRDNDGQRHEGWR